MKWLKVITVGLLLIGLSSSLEFFADPADPPDAYPVSGSQQLTDRQWSLMFLGVIDTSYPFYKGLKTWTETRYKYVKKSLWFDIFGIFGSRYYKVLKSKDIHRYDKAGREMEWYSYYKGDPDLISSTDREVKHTFEYKYDDKGNLIEELHNTNGTLYMRTVIKYDESGNKIAQIIHTGEPAKERFRFTYKHDQSGNGFEITTYRRRNDRNRVTDKRHCKFDEQERLIETIRYEKDGKSVKYKRTYKYVDKRNGVQAKTYNADGKLTNVRNYRRNTYGNEIPAGCTDKYNQKGNMIERAFLDKKRRPYRKLTYKYDDKGNLIEKNEYEVKQEDNKDIAIPKKQTTYEYEFYPEDKESEEPGKK